MRNDRPTKQTKAGKSTDIIIRAWEDPNTLGVDTRMTAVKRKVADVKILTRLQFAHLFTH